MAIAVRIRDAALAVALVASTVAAGRERRSTEDPWTRIVTTAADRADVVRALGEPAIEFTAFVAPDATPVQIVPLSEPPPPEEGDGNPLAKMRLLRVLEYDGGVPGMRPQVVLSEAGRVLYAIAPPLADETTVVAVRKRMGAAKYEVAEVLHGDLMRTWGLLAYPKKGRIYVHAPGDDRIVARQILPRG